jgi:hypothetical protein
MVGESISTPAVDLQLLPSDFGPVLVWPLTLPDRYDRPYCRARSQCGYWTWSQDWSWCEAATMCDHVECGRQGSCMDCQLDYWVEQQCRPMGEFVGLSCRGM